MRILGIDPGYAIVGVGCIDYEGNRFKTVEYGAITTDAGEDMFDRLKKIYDDFHSKGLEIIGVSLDHNRVGWQKAIEKDGLNWINVSSLKGWECEVVRQYNVKGVPSLFILNENNRIIATGLRDEELRAFLEERLK